MTTEDSKAKTNAGKQSSKKTTSASSRASSKKVTTAKKQSSAAVQKDNVEQKEQQAFGVSQTQGKDAPKNLEGLLETLVRQLLQEQRRNRRWGIFFKLTTLAFALLVLVLVFDITGSDYEVEEYDDFTAVVEVHGMIAPGAFTSSDQVIDNLRSAFEHKGTRGVILDINSPGGSPVQSGQIYDEIVQLQQKYPKIKVYAVISDLGASGAYYVAAAADEIFADKSSLVGSIGVIYSGFGYTELMDNMGIERRLVVAGKNKAFLDPFSPEDTDLTAFWQDVLAKTHQQFVNSVVKKRGDKLADDEQIFSGLIYNAEQALELGLIDHFGDKRYVASEIVGYEDLRYFTTEDEQWLEWAKRLGVAMATSFTSVMHNLSYNPVIR